MELGRKNKGQFDNEIGLTVHSNGEKEYKWAENRSIGVSFPIASIVCAALVILDALSLTTLTRQN
jgi:hypothetical protein